MDAVKPLLIGLSARIIHKTSEDFEVKGKTIQYLEQNLAHLVGQEGALVVMIPSLESHSILERSDLDVHNYAEALDGLVLQGGVDISPSLYGEEPLEVMSQHRQDPIRDRYEMKLLHAFVQRKKPVLGICRGFQLMNVYSGGTLFQDLPTQRPQEVAHYRSDLYDRLTHDVKFVENGMLQKLYGKDEGKIISIHHQGVKKLGYQLTAEAHSDDGLIEAFSSQVHPFFVGVQWHPEFQQIEGVLSAQPLVESFIQACHEQRLAPATRLQLTANS